MFTTEIEINPYQLKLELIRYIDGLNESRLVQLYQHLIHPADKKQDFWLSLSEWEREDIQSGLEDLNQGRKSDFFEFMSN